MGKYSGKDLEITRGSTAIPCTNIRAITVDESSELIDITGACDTFMQYLVSRRDVDVSLELLDDTVPGTVFGLFASNEPDTLIIYPRGNIAGRPKLTNATFIVTGRSRPISYNDAVTISVTGKASAGFVEGTV